MDRRKRWLQWTITVAVLSSSGLYFLGWDMRLWVLLAALPFWVAYCVLVLRK